MDQEEKDVLDQSIEEIEKVNEELQDLDGGMDEEELVEDSVLDSQALVEVIWEMLEKISEPFKNEQQNNDDASFGVCWNSRPDYTF